MANDAATDILCGLCEFKSSSLADYKKHILSEHHMKKVPEEGDKKDEVTTNEHKIKEAKNKELHHCYLCNVTCNGEVCWKAHLEGSKHKKKNIQHQVGHDAEKENLQSQRNTFIFSNQNIRPQYSSFKSFKRHPYKNENHHIPSLMDQEIHPPSFLAADDSLFNEENVSDELMIHDTNGMRAFKRSAHKNNFRKTQRWNDMSDFSQKPSNAYEMSFSSQRDIGDEIKDEIKRVQKQAEETRLAQQRKKEIKYDEIRAFKREQMHEDTPPPPPRTLDDETKRLVMQNLVELAKCCVTNEADAELALQVSNALTQALLQYKMKNMPSSVLQTLGSVPHQQFLQQQQQQYFIGNAQPPNQYAYPNAPPHQPAPIEGTHPQVAPIEIGSSFPAPGENLYPPVQFQHYQQAPNYSQYFVPQNNHYNFHEQPQQHVPMQQIEMSSFEPQHYEQFGPV